jgi:hypothetical protein
MCSDNSTGASGGNTRLNQIGLFCATLAIMLGHGWATQIDGS